LITGAIKPAFILQSLDASIDFFHVSVVGLQSHFIMLSIIITECNETFSYTV